VIKVTYSDDITKIARANQGVVTTRQITTAGIPRYALATMVANGELDKLERGIYLLCGQWGDEYKIYSLRYRKGVFSHDTALFLHRLTDTTPDRFTMTFPAGYNTKSLENSLLDVRRTMAGIYGLGLTVDTHTPSGNLVTCYNKERTLCDILRGSEADNTDRSKTAFQRYISKADKNINRLLEYASVLHVTSRVQNYLKALL
jgi:predicted transcriptional regulator of viral defense system